MNWTLRNRLVAGCACLVAVSTIACLIGWRQASASQRGVAELVAVSNQNAKHISESDTIGILFGEARRAQHEFLFEKTTASLQAAEELNAQAAMLRDAVRNLDGFIGLHSAATPIPSTQATPRATPAEPRRRPEPQGARLT